jgi:hypothetical protein
MANELAPTLPTQITSIDDGDAPPRLSATQSAALEGLLAGKTVTEAAAAAGVGRTTIHKWMRVDFAFQAALNRGRRDLQQAVACRVDQLAADAAECVIKAVREGDAKIALQILKHTNALGPRKIGSDDELSLEMEHQQQIERRHDQMVMSGLHRKLLSRVQ